MGFYFQDDFWESCSELAKKERDATAAAIIAYYFEQEEPAIKGASKAVFIAFRERIDLSRKRSNASKSKPDQNDEQTVDQNEIKPTSDLLKRESKSKKDLEEPPLPPLDERDGEAAEFAVEALAVFNAETGQDVRDLSPSAWQGLRRIYDSGRTLEDVRTVVKLKRGQWVDDARMARYVRPSTLFGPKFDEYLNESEGDVNDAEFAEYAEAF